jgi:hypothetical protein
VFRGAEELAVTAIEFEELDRLAAICARLWNRKHHVPERQPWRGLTHTTFTDPEIVKLSELAQERIREIENK